MWAPPPLFEQCPKENIFLQDGFPYVACTHSETLCGVSLIYGIVIPRIGSDVRKSKGFLPCFFHTFFALCKILKHLGVPPIEEIFVILEFVNLFQFVLTGRLSIVVHLIGLPFCWVFVTVGNQAAVVPILVHVLHAGKELTCCNNVLLIFQLKLYLSEFYS